MRRILIVGAVVLLLASVAGGVGWYCQLGAEQPKDDVKVITNSIGMMLVPIAPGKFVMGSPENEVHRGSDELQHEVAITKPFHLGTYEVTQGEYAKILGNNPSFFAKNGGGKQRVGRKDTSSHPVERVSWNDAVEFCKKLSAKEGKTYRLPTEAEWEYACRAGSKTVFHMGNDFNGNLGNINGLAYSSYGKEEAGPFYRVTVPCGEYKENKFHLFDMHGNAQEWCSDWYAADYYKKSPKDDPPGPANGTERVLRGGAWPSSAKACRSAGRNHLPPDEKSYTTGFRVVLEMR
ncbi:MAG: formylglycine-generating enzyme family protein [Gemmataceae bacterium]|nr:formylglycine-generating enzyme family protein [Gemmataceae bacterium]